MTILRKIGFYLIGLSAGIIFLAYFLKGKNAEFCYFPNCRVLKDLRAQPMEYDSLVLTTMKTERLTKDDLSQAFTSGEVDFNASETNTSPCKTYYIEANMQESPYRITVKRCSEGSKIIQLQKQKPYLKGFYDLVIYFSSFAFLT